MNRHLNYVLFIAVALFTSSCMGIESEDDISEKEIEETNLQTLTDVELEQMCTSRGFELVKDTDKETGEAKEYSHNDYVDAAKQCLDMEAEMEQILSENPQMLDDIEAEAKKMREEKVRLERELAEAKSKLLMEEATIDTPNAFINKIAHEKMIDLETDDEPGPQIIEHVANDEDDEIIDLDVNAQKEDQMTNIPLLDADTTGQANQETSSDEHTPLVEDSIKHSPPEFSVITPAEFIQEFRNRITEDFLFVRNIILPEHLRGPLMDALNPAIRISKNTAATAFDLVKKYVLLMLENGAEQKDNEGKDEHVSTETAQN
eukprot:CAMPEP_0198274032 /NCGR_PEP_ID=MMETSP1447-20131203/58897_1 /TAXON_ID=420782 /ORGANISM="Chaetoceros dichaeta, Strain CCMP1751" /LENGTH=317 /DNA_ID=CAMNT_0043967979 /DNA_START=1 /DNA_END=954 /DNA_ORIENTATION=+